MTDPRQASAGHELAGWALEGSPIVRGALPPAASTIGALSDGATRERLIATLLSRRIAATRRAAALTMVHYALHAVGAVILAPLVFDGVAVEVAPGEVGLAIAGDGNLGAVWLGRPRRITPEDAVSRAGRAAMRLVGPVAKAATTAADVPVRGMTNIVLDSLHDSCEWFERRAAGPSGGIIGPQLLEAIGYGGHRLGRVLLARPDDGPPLQMRVPVTCCVLSAEVSAHACPTCPRHPDDETRLQRVHDWLAGLDDDGFRSVTGRERQHDP